MEDRRIRKTREAISEAFLALLENKSINKITVAEISRAADLGRGTFYLHYTDVYDLYDKIESGIYAKLEDIYAETVPNNTPENLLRLTTNITDFIKANKPFFVLFARPDNPGTGLNRLKGFLSEKVVMEEELLTGVAKPVTQEYIAQAQFIVSGVIGVLEKWITDGLKQPSGQISAVLQELILRAQTPAGG